MNSYPDTTQPALVPEQDEVILRLPAAMLSSIGLFIVSTVLSLVAWRMVWIEVVVPLAVMPLAVWTLGAVGLVVRATVRVFVQREQPPTVVESDNVRLIPMYSGQRTEGVDRRDLAYFVSTALRSEDWRQRSWVGQVMPSGRKCDVGMHAQMMDVLTKFRCVVDYGPRATGHRAMDADEALKLLGLSSEAPYPSQS